MRGQPRFKVSNKSKQCAGIANVPTKCNHPVDCIALANDVTAERAVSENDTAGYDECYDGVTMNVRPSRQPCVLSDTGLVSPLLRTMDVTRKRVSHNEFTFYALH